MDSEICRYIDEQKDNFLSDLSGLIEIRSVRSAAMPGKPFGEGVYDALCEAKRICARHGFEMTDFDGYAGEVQFGKAPDVMLLAHLDVVPEGELWTRPPYKLTAEGDRIYGRGTTDDKGAAMAALYAISCCKELFGEPVTGVRLVLGCGEETGSEDLEYYFSKREKLRYTFSPDADYPIINLEKGRFAPVFEKHIKTHTAQKTVVEFIGGDTANIVPAKATAVITGLNADEIKNYTTEAAKMTGAEFLTEARHDSTLITCKGTSTHAASPHLGINAQTALIKLISLLPLDEDETAKSFRSLAGLFAHGETDGESIGVKMSDEESGALTLNFGVLSFADGKFSGQLDLRLPLCANVDNVNKVIEQKLGEEGFVFSGTPQSTAVHFVSKDSPAIKEALKVYEDYTGKPGECLAIGGGTYVHDIEGGVAFGIEFPDTDYHIHGADEFAVTDELLLTAKMYAQIIKNLCY